MPRTYVNLDCVTHLDSQFTFEEMEYGKKKSLEIHGLANLVCTVANNTGTLSQTM